MMVGVHWVFTISVPVFQLLGLDSPFSSLITLQEECEYMHHESPIRKFIPVKIKVTVSICCWLVGERQNPCPMSW